MLRVSHIEGSFGRDGRYTFPRPAFCVCGPEEAGSLMGDLRYNDCDPALFEDQIDYLCVHKDKTFNP